MKQVRVEQGARLIDSERLEYANAMLAWVQSPPAEEPQLKGGHGEILKQAFGSTRLRTITARIESIEDESEKTVAQLLIAGFGSELTHQLYPEADMSKVMGAIGLKRTLQASDDETSTKSIPELFSLREEGRYEFLKRLLKDGELTAMDPLGERRFMGITDRGTYDEFIRVFNSLPGSDQRVVAMLLAGFSKEELIAQFGESQIYISVDTVKTALQQARKRKARSDEKTILNYGTTVRRLKKLPDDPGWGTKVACNPTNDYLLTPRRGRSGNVDPRARLLCGACMVRLQCLNDALNDEHPSMIRGGMSPSERGALREVLMDGSVGTEKPMQEGVA